MDKNVKKINIQDSTFSHCIFSNNPLPPIQFSEDVEWVRKESYPDEENVIYTDEKIFFSRGNKEKDIAWLIEPEKLKPNIYKYVKENHKKFKIIFTHDKDILELDNASFIPYGGCWVHKRDCSLHKKHKNISIIASNKNQLDGHKLRHEIISKFKKHIDIFGNGYKKINNKINGLKDYRFHLVIENTKKDYWFTEKLIDSMMTGAVPIYYGCPSIEKFFNTHGIVQINNLNDFDKILRNLTEEFYDQKMPFIKENFKLASNYFLAEKYISKFFK